MVAIAVYLYPVGGCIMETNSEKWAGVDWGDGHHDVSVFDGATGKHQLKRVPHTPEGLETLVSFLKSQGPLGGVAVESTRCLVVCKLLQADFKVYGINPKLSHCWREAANVAGAKSDPGDARILAEELFRRHENLHPVLLDEPEQRVLAFLCEDEQRLTHDRTRQVQRLESALKQYFPAALEFFTDWTSPTAWDFVRCFSTPKALARASEARLYKFLRTHKVGISQTWKKRVGMRVHATDWPLDESAIEAGSLRAKCIVEELKVIEKSLQMYRKRIDLQIAKLPNAELFRSLPGAGVKIAPRLQAIFGSRQDRYEDASVIQELSGAAPVTKRSGKVCTVQIRRACRKRWRHTLHLFAGLSKRYCGWARAYYRLCRDRGDRNATALRKLAYKWLRIIFRMWQTKKPYDDKLYVKQLEKKGSPTFARMKQHEECG